jgi:hypothetical protein
MSLRNRNPSEPRQADKPQTKVYPSFYGMVTGEPASEIGDMFAAMNFNVIDRGEYFTVRSGSKIYSSASQAFKYTVDPATDIFTTSFKHSFVTGDSVYFFGDELPGPLIADTEYFVIVLTGYTFQIASSYENAAWASPIINIVSAGSSSLWVSYGKINAFCDQIKESKLVWMLGNSVYISNKAISSYTKALNLNGTNPSDVSMMVAYDNFVVLASKTGIFKVVLNDTFNYFYKLNIDNPIVRITDIPENVGSSVIWGYLVNYSVCRLSGTGNRDRTSDDTILELESATSNDPASEKDYGEVYFADAVGLVGSGNHVIGPLTVPDDVNECTHFGIYRTKNIGEHSGGVSADANGIGNRRDQFQWDSDVPVAKAFLVDTLSVAGRATIIAGTNPFVLGDVGSVLSDGFYSSTITGYISSSTVTISGTLRASASRYVCIGGGRVGKANLSNHRITITNAESDWADVSDVGKTIFVSDGTVLHVTGFDGNGGLLIVQESVSFTGLVITIRPLSGNFTRNWNLTVPDMPQADGRVSIQDRIEYGSDLYVPRRFFSPLPNGNIVHIDNGFMVVSNRDDSQYSYSQIGDKLYCMGQCQTSTQQRSVTGTIRHIVGIPSNAVIVCKAKTIILALTNSQNVGKTDVGENVFQLPEPSVTDPNRGVIAWRSLVFKNNVLYAFTNDSGYRYFDGTKWSEQNLAFSKSSSRGSNEIDAVYSKYLQNVDHSSPFIASYNPAGGMKMWIRTWAGKSTMAYKMVQYSTDSTQAEIQMSLDSRLTRGSGLTDKQMFTAK